MRRTVEKAAAVAEAGSGEQRGSSAGVTGAAVAATVQVGAAVAAVNSRLAGGLGLLPTPAWTHRRGREGGSEPGRLGSTSFVSLMQASRNAATS